MPPSTDAHHRCSTTSGVPLRQRDNAAWSLLGHELPGNMSIGCGDSVQLRFILVMVPIDSLVEREDLLPVDAVQHFDGVSCIVACARRGKWDEHH